VRRVVVLGHGLGALMAVEWLAKDRPPKVVKALVTVGLSADLKGSGSGALGALAGIHLPVLDIFGSDDLPAVRGTARARLAAARRAGNHKYRQVQVEGADHFFHDQDDELVGRVRAWIARVTGTSARAR
jgi:pimeloyl-ACP methyl ester carboxylesterase